MFTSNNSYSYPQLLPPSLHIPSLTHPCDLLLHQQPCLQDGHLFQPASAAAVAGTVNMVVSAKAAFDNQSIKINLNTNGCDPLGLRHTKKRKDRHRKIVTAQGPRDRRVRLSIEISRKFFALQDMLGFDKASKTLDWLLNKSRTAVKDLIQMKHGVDSATSECELLLGTDGVADAGDLQRMVCRNGSSFGDANKEKKKRQTCKTTVQLLARESRAKARARARERTRAKMKAKKMKETKMLSQSHHSSSPSIPNQSKYLNQSESFRKLISDLNSNNFYPPSNLGNWGINTSSITYRGFTALTNMNPSTVLQICSKPWEIYKLHNE